VKRVFSHDSEMGASESVSEKSIHEFSVKVEETLRIST